MSRVPNHKYDVVAVDCGIKYNIIRLLNRVGCNVTVVPYDTTAEQILAFTSRRRCCFRTARATRMTCRG